MYGTYFQQIARRRGIPQMGSGNGVPGCPVNSKVPKKLLFPLATKVLVPRIPARLMERTRLLNVVAPAESKQLIVIKAPAGFGKTCFSIVWAERLRESGNRVAWLALEPDDDEPIRFLYYVAKALHRSCGDIGSAALGLIAETSLVAPQAVTSTLINELADFEEEAYLFLDDYHCVTHPLIHKAISFLLEHAPSNFHLVLMTRSEPTISSMIRLHIRNQLLVIDTSMLRFAFDETRHFLEQEQGGRLELSDVTLLHATTEGWPAALRIAASATLWHEEDLAQHVRALSGASRPFAAYLEDMLTRLPDETVKFMSRTAILDRLSPSLCQAITGATESRELLESLASRQLLLEPLDADGSWYRYHHLLADYLYRRLEARYGGELLELHRRAYRWYASAELWTDAVKHAIAAGDLDRAMTWIENCAMALVTKGDLITLLGWQRHLPTRLMHGQTRIRLAIAWGLALAMRFDEAVLLLADIERNLTDVTASNAEQLRCECQAVRSTATALRDDSENALSLAEACLGQKPADPWTANVLSNVLRFGYWQGRRLDDFYAAPWVPYSLEEDKRNVFSSIYRLSFLGLVALQQLHFGVAENQYLEATRLAQHYVGPQSAAAALPEVLLAQIRYEQGRLAEAESMIVDRLHNINTIGMLECVLRAYVVLSRIAASARHFERAYALLERAETLGLSRRWGRLVAAALVERLRLYIVEGRMIEASACVIRLERLAEEYPVSVRCAWTAIHNYLALARAALASAENRPQDAVPILTKLLDEAVLGRDLYFASRLGTALSVALIAANEPDAAETTFVSVLNAGAPAGLYRTILDQGWEIGTLLQRSVERADRAAPFNEVKPYVNRLIAGWRHIYEPTQGPSSGIKESLSPRERNIIELIAAGQTNKEIARSLGITPETVKTHLKNIFVRFSVTKRSQAVARAQSLGLVKT